MIESEIEQHDIDGAHRRWLVDLHQGNADEILESIQTAWSVTLRILGRGQEMAVSFSNGLAAIMLTAGEDDFYDFVAREPQNGWAEFVHGGQPAEHPRRHCVSALEALSCVKEFLLKGSVALPDTRWERQEKYQNTRQ